MDKIVILEKLLRFIKDTYETGPSLKANAEVIGLVEKNGSQIGNYKVVVKDVNPSIASQASGIVSLNTNSGKCFIEED